MVFEIKLVVFSLYNVNRTSIEIVVKMELNARLFNSFFFSAYVLYVYFYFLLFLSLTFCCVITLFFLWHSAVSLHYSFSGVLLCHYTILSLTFCCVITRVLNHTYQTQKKQMFTNNKRTKKKSIIPFSERKGYIAENIFKVCLSK
jgi:hypothetical protein